MNRTTQLFKGEDYLQNNFHLYVNRCTEDFLVPFHSHDFFEFCYVAEGSGFHHIENEIFPVKKGMLFAIPIGTSHVFRPTSTESLKKPLIVYNCLFNENMINKLALVIQESPIKQYLMSLGSSDTSYFSVFDYDGLIEELMINLYREMSVPTVGSTTMLPILLTHLIVTVYRLKFGETDKSTKEVTDFDQVIQYVENNVHESITLTDLAAISRWSNRHLQRMFVKHTGQNFSSYLQNLRVNKSCEVLRSTSLKIAMVAELVGYHDIDSFNAVFKKIVGQTPTAYRRIYKS
ncbi:AraC family transcriptional regulator [Paenibacillus endoradicis]|uniref:AraC family transcriptional regulator n=1 Tax=Paenibacillus endoradicis TaxID=2972487 RepID=UPI002158A818|nr:AraC family transcriptional regulator [Paenibacillus endoradicis]MCR8657012.1 AraC family transcriptional regulator [Paenibacillus endoradicis]